MRKIEFLTFGSSSAFGSFAPGDILRCDDEVARHFVEDASCARYADEAPKVTQAQDVEAAPSKPAKKTRA